METARGGDSIIFIIDMARLKPLLIPQMSYLVMLSLLELLLYLFLEFMTHYQQ